MNTNVVAVLVPSTGSGVRGGERLYNSAAYCVRRRQNRGNSSPGFERQTRHMGKFLGICGNQRQIENERVTGNQQIVRTDWRSCCLQFKAKQAGPATRISSERNFFNNVHQGLYFLRFATRIPRAGSAGKEFKTRDDRDPAIVRRHCAQFVDDRWDIAQQINAGVRVQQVFHATVFRGSALAEDFLDQAAGMRGR